MGKTALRKRMRETLSGIPAAGLREKSLEIGRRLASSREFAEAGSILAYVSLPGEPETRGIIKKALRLKKAVYAPKVEGDSVCVCRLHGLEGLKPGRFGICEPPGEARCGVHEFGLVLVPGLAFDPRGRRLGRGGGFYDRLLSEASGEFAALAFDEQVVARVPTAPHDVRVDRIFTDKRVIECRKS